MIRPISLQKRIVTPQKNLIFIRKMVIWGRMTGGYGLHDEFKCFEGLFSSLSAWTFQTEKMLDAIDG